MHKDHKTKFDFMSGSSKGNKCEYLEVFISNPDISEEVPPGSSLRALSMMFNDFFAFVAGAGDKRLNSIWVIKDITDTLLARVFGLVKDLEFEIDVHKPSSVIVTETPAKELKQEIESLRARCSDLIADNSAKDAAFSTLKSEIAVFFQRSG